MSPGLQLVNPQKLPRDNVKVLAAGISEKVLGEGFPALPGVEEELLAIQKQLSNTSILLNQDFTAESLRSKLRSNNFSIVHLATHGEFSSDLENTFLLAWKANEEDDFKININELQELLENPDLTGETAIELLVLSACKTAQGDERAALGLAGVALRSGARSTVATLWPVNDEATALFMEDFYQRLSDTSITRSEALRLSQESLRNNDRFSHPFYWAPYTLIGNWL